MGRRSIILGLVFAVLICGVTFFNDLVVKGPHLIGNYLPIAVFGLALLLVLVVNPILRWIAPRLVLTGVELATIMIMVLFVCYIAGGGLMNFFTDYMIMPQYYRQTATGWKSKPPEIEASEVKNWPQLIARLRENTQGGDAGLRAVWAALPEEPRRAMAAAGDGAGDDLAFRTLVLGGINHVIRETRFGLAVPNVRKLALRRHVNELLARDPAALKPEDVAFINRGVLDALLPGIVSPHRLGAIDRAPSRMLVDVDRNTSVVLDGFVTGIAGGNKTISFAQVPWTAWWRPFLFWGCILLTLFVMVTGLSLVLHRQWASHEHLPYPAVEFARALLPEAGQVWSSTLRNRLFWVGCAPVLLLHMNNYARLWWPDYLIQVRTGFDLTPLLDLIPVMKNGNWAVFLPTIYFAVLGFAFFLPTDVSLSMGIAPYLYSFVISVLAVYGVSVDKSYLTSSMGSSFHAGAYLAMFAVLLFSGRHYYAAVFRRGVGLRGTDEVEKSSVWGSRMFVAGVAAMMLQLFLLGVDWQMGILYILGMLAIYTVMSRLLAEAGVFFLHPGFLPCAMMAGLFGARAVGCDQLLILSLISGLLLIDPREALMPFVMSGVCLADRMRLRIGRTVAWGLLAFVLGLAVAVPIALRLQYQHGAMNAGYSFYTTYVPRSAYDTNTEVCRKLEARGTLEDSTKVSGWGHFRHLEPPKSYLVGFFITFSLVLLFTFCRHRFAYWPLHPVIFLMLGSWQSNVMGFSFLLGCAFKSAVTKYGGARIYQAVKPLMIGLVAGDILAIVMIAVVSSIYYMVTGEPPKTFSILP